MKKKQIKKLIRATHNAMISVEELLDRLDASPTVYTKMAASDEPEPKTVMFDMDWVIEADIKDPLEFLLPFEEWLTTRGWHGGGRFGPHTEMKPVTTATQIEGMKF